MLLWFVGTAWVSVWFVFRDERFDYRILALGALLPDIIDGVTGGAWVMHSVTASVAVLTVVMLATRGRRPARRGLLALPIGTFMHLVFDAAFSRTRMFWWPFSGLSNPGVRLPSIDRGAWNVLLELLGAAAIVWMGKRHGLADPERRGEFLRTGALREDVPPVAGPGTC